jgi:hypothetical protein
MKVTDLLLENKEITKSIRDLLKKKYKLTTRDVSVRTNYISINIKIKTLKALPYYEKIEKIGSKHEEIERDEITGEILSGGNLFVFVEIDYDLKREIAKKLSEILEKNNKRMKFANLSLRFDEERNSWRLDGNHVLETAYGLESLVGAIVKATAKRKSTWEEFLKIIK